MRTLSRKMGLLGDVHCEDHILAAALELFGHEKVEAVLCVGDIVDGPGDPQRTVRLLREANVAAVRGNHERWWLQDSMRDLPDATPAEGLSQADRAWLNGLPATREYETPLGGPLLLCHGLLDDDMATLRPGDGSYDLAWNMPLRTILREKRYTLVVSGHSHQRMVRTLSGVTFVNAGTLFRDHEPCVAVVDFEAATARFFDWASGQFVPNASIPIGR